MGGYAINLALTGALNTLNRSVTASGRDRYSWLGGTQTAVPDVSGAMLFFEYTNKWINFSPTINLSSDSSAPSQISYPFAIREFWAGNMKKLDASCNPLSDDDSRLVFANVIVCGMADGSSKALKTDRFLAMTPRAADMGVPLDSNWKCGCMYNNYPSCQSGGNYFTVEPKWTKPWPFWALN